MGKKFRLTAWILAVSILLNMVPLPASAQEDAAAAQSNAEESIQNVQPLADVDDELNNNQTGGTGDGQNGGTGDEENGGTGDGQNGGTGDEENGGTGDEQNGGTGEVENGGTGEEENGGTGEEENGGTGDELIVGDDNELIIGDDNNLGDSGSDQSDDVTDEELMIMPLEGESEQTQWETVAEWENICNNYNATTGLVIDSGWDLICLSHIAPSLYYDKKLVLTATYLDTTTCPEGAESSLQFQGLGTDEYPFVGTVEYASGTESVIVLNRPLFNRLSFRDGTSICKMYLKSSQNTTALLANTVDGCTNEAIQVFLEAPEAPDNVDKVLPPVFNTINVQDGRETNIQISVTKLVTETETVKVTGNGLICNTQGSGARLTVTAITNYPGLTAASGDAGGLVGRMESGSSLEVAGNDAIEIANVSATSGNAGGLVGSMAGTASVTVNTAVTVSGISGSNAGGLVGKMDSGTKLDVSSTGSLILKDTDTVTGSANAGGCVGFATDIVFNVSTITVDASATVNGTGNAGVGGLIGTYTYNGTADRFNSVLGITIPGLKLTCGGDGGSAGALFGRLSNDSKNSSLKTFSISDVTVEGVVFQNGSVGGLIGKYGTDDLGAALEISDVNVNTSLTSNATDYGGLIGLDNCGSPAYIKISGADVMMNASGTPTDFGGLVSRLQNKEENSHVGHLLNLEGNVTVTVDGNFKAGNSTGGLVAYLQNGVIRIGGNVTIKGTLAATDKDRGGWVVGDLRNALVYVDKSVADARLTLTNKAGTKYNDLGRWGQVLEANDDTYLPGLLTFSEENHTVTVAAANGSYQIANLKDFAAVALRLQLNEIDSLKFTDGDISDPVDITIGADITLRNGLFGFQRDHSGSDPFNVTIHGDGHKITLPNTVVYPTGESHNRLGLLSNVNTLVAENLTVDGGITFDQSSGSIYAGALAACAAGNVTLTSVTGSAGISGSGSMGSDELSGLIAHVGDGKKLTFTGCSWTSTITDNSISSDVYVGGFLGKGTNATMNVSGSSTLSGRIQRNSAATAKVGGLAASLSGGTLSIDGLTISNAHIEAPSATDTCGGLLSYELLDIETNIAGVTITDSSVNANSAGFGGLVYKASNVMTIEKNAEGIGVSIGTGNSFAGGSSDSAPSGLLVCRGDKANETDKALYLKVLDGAYSVDSGTTVTLSDDTDYFDELVGITEGASGNGVVSYATSGNALIDQSGCNTYQQKIANGDTIWNNPHTRYYYNLDSFPVVVDGTVDSPEKMVMWSVSQYCADELKSNFANGVSFEITGDIPLAGYSYYPVSPRDGVSINGATITFDYDKLESMEALGANKEPSNSYRQHYLMHTGIFENVSQSLSVNNLTLSGIVGPAANGSGALISGSIASNKEAGSITLAINALTLNNLKISGGDTSGYAPLLINRIGSFVTMNMDGVSTSGYTATTTAATSLIGYVGDATNGTDIRLTFSNMALDAKTDGAGNPDYYGSQGTIFSHATFLESFAYSDKTTCFGEYNFVMDDGNYTVGKEISNTVSGRNMTNQYKDSNEIWVKYPDGAVTTETTPEHFWNGYLPYVCVSENEGNKVYELDINQRPKDLTKGCGTYGDPYVIEYASQLAAVAKIIRDENVYDWSVRMNNQVLTGGFENQDGHGPNPVSGDTNYKLNRSDGKWHPETGDMLENDSVRDYLRNAYYQISADLNLSSTWGGLGSADMPFMGVIVGKKEDNGIPTIRITATQAKQYGGLVKFSQGSVIKNLKIEFSGSATVLDAGVPTVLSDAAFFGGVVGWCHGGDTIIDNVSVTGLNVPSISGSNTYLAAVGGYVGLAGGYNADTGGGVVFKGTISGGLSGGNADGGSGYYYVNPYVGRVLDGYAVYSRENGSLDNTDKNYKIPTINGNDHLNAAQNKLTVKDADGLWLLSAIVNSGAGNASNDSAYTTGKARSCDYSKVGTALVEANDLLELNDEKGDSKPYLVETFTNNNSFSSLTSQSSVQIELGGDCNMTGYGNGFRGIGTSYGYDRLLNVGSLTSANDHNYKVILYQNRQEYTAESGKWVSRGAGLFTQLKLSGNLTVSNLTLCGQTGITYDATTTIVKYDSSNYPGAGLLVGILKGESTGNTVSLTNVSLAKYEDDKSEIAPKVVGTAAHAGGLIGHYNATSTSVTLTDCDCSNVTVTGGMNAGGLVGYINAGTTAVATVTYNSVTKLSNIDVKAMASTPTVISGSGGLIGMCEPMVLKIESSSDNKLTVDDTLTVQYMISDSTEADIANCGGLVGLWCVAKNDSQTYDAVIQNISLEGTVHISTGKNGNAGGLVGALSNDHWNWDQGGSARIKIANVDIAQGNSRMVVNRGRQVGGLLGVLKANGGTTVSNVRIGSENGSVTVANNGEGVLQSVGGLFGVIVLPKLSLNQVQVKNVKTLVHKSNLRGGGLLFGYVEKGGQIDLRHLAMEDSTVAVDNVDANIGLLYGRLNSGTQTITGADILVRDCCAGLSLAYAENNKTYSLKSLYDSTENVPTDDRVGLKLSNTYKGYDALADVQWSSGTTGMEKYTGGNNLCIWGGSNDGNKTVQLVGVSLQQTQNMLPAKDFGSTLNSGSYLIRANYLGKDVLVDATETTPVEVHATDKPETNCASLPTLADNKKLTGDGVYFFDKEKKEGVASQIRADYSGKNWKRMGLDSSVSVKDDIGKFIAGGDDFSLTTFASTKSKTSGTVIDDFPVLKITAKETKTINEVVDAYISMLTNTHFSHPSASTGKVQKIANCPYTIEATTYAWSGDGFTAMAEAEKTLKVVDDNVLQSNGGRFDCDKDQFTLLDVKFADPKSMETPKPIVYHLYIPVVIEKKLEYKFWAAAQIGTSYNAGDYSNLSDWVIGSHHEPVTVMIGFEYLRTGAEWQSAVDSGENLLWHLNKEIKLTDAMQDNSKIPLPDGTELILVDRGITLDAGQKDRAYTATVNASQWEWSGGTCTLNFTNFTALGGTGAFQARDFCDELKLIAEEDNTNGTFVETVPGDASLRAQLGDESRYFRLATTDDKGSKYTVTVGLEDDKTLSEQYYLTIRTPEVTAGVSPINNFTVWYENPTVSGRMPTELIKWDATHPYARKGNENQIILSNFFKQEFKIIAETPDADPVAAKTGDDIQSRSNIVATLKTVITFENEEHATTFKHYFGSGTLHQCFDLSLMEIANGAQSNKPFVKGAQIAVDYGDGSGSTISLTQSQESVRLIGNSDGYSVTGLDENGTLTMEAKVYLAYDAAGIVEQFPTRPQGTTDGIQIRGSSSLAYSAEALTNSFIRKNDEDTNKHIYYRRSDSAATMSYSARENEASAPGDSVSQLGINGLEDNFPIKSLGIYNVERVENASSAKYLKCTVSLYCKDNATNQYMPVTGSIGSYLPELKLGLDITDAGGTIAHTAMTAPAEDDSVIFALPETFDPGSFIEIPVEMKVLTGEAFEELGYRYANYQVRLTARLLVDENGTEIANSEASDYIVYTNAKILRELIFQQSGT